MQLTLGPVLYHWKPDIWRDFYYRIADEAPVDIVSIGETVCSKRAPFYADSLPPVVERLERAGKAVQLSSYALVSQERERKAMEALVREARHPVEVNDVSSLAHMDGKPHVIGPFVNTYNEGTARYLASLGATRITLPPELPLDSVTAIAKGCPEVIVEAFAFGRMPLAISARCYHARLHKHSKDNCRFVCELDPDGLEVDTLKGEKFLSVNGVQTLSFACSNLLPHLGALREGGVKALRLSPQHCDMAAIARVYRDAVDGRLDIPEAVAECRRIYPDVPFADGFSLGAPGAEWKATFARVNGVEERL